MSLKMSPEVFTYSSVAGRGSRGHRTGWPASLLRHRTGLPQSRWNVPAWMRKYEHVPEQCAQHLELQTLLLDLPGCQCNYIMQHKDSFVTSAERIFIF